MKNIIFCDIDGTIIDGSRGMSKVSNKTRYAFKELQKDSCIVIASGRNKGLLNEEILSLNPNGFILCNGAYAEINNNALYSYNFTDEAVSMIREVSERYDGFSIFETVEDVYVNSLTCEPFIRFMKSWALSLTGFKEGIRNDRYNISMIGFNDFTPFDKVYEELSPYVNLARHNGFPSMDVNITGIHKGTGVRKIIEYLDIPLENTYCFGDGANDLEMLKEVGHPIIMANADDTLRNYNFEQTDDVLNDGVYNYLVSHKLIKEL